MHEYKNNFCSGRRNKKIPKLAQRKVKKLLDFLSREGLSWDDTGLVNNPPSPFSSPFSILPFALYAVKGKDRPHEWYNFVNFLSKLKIPREFLCLKAITDIKRAKRNEKEKDNN